MNTVKKKAPALGVDQNVVSALMQLYVAGQRAEDGHMPHLLTANGLRVAIEPDSGAVNLAYGSFMCELSAAEAYELATMMTAAADALRHLGDSDSTSAQGVGTILTRMKSADATLS